MTIKELSNIAEWLFPYYMEYRNEGHGDDRALTKALINYEECNNRRLNNEVTTLMYEVMKELEMTLPAV